MKVRYTDVLYYAFNVLLCALFLFPLLWMLSTAFKSSADIFVSPPRLLADQLILDNFATVLGDRRFVTYFSNSMLITCGTIVFTTIVASLAGYSFAKIPFWGKGILFVFFLVPLMVPFQAILIPLFIIIRNFGLIDTKLGLIVIYTTFQLPLSIFLMRNTFDSIPSEIIDAALIDGCSFFGVFRRIMLPLSWVGLVTVVVFVFMNVWNEYLVALVFTTSESMRTLQVGLTIMQTSYSGMGGVQWHILSAGNIINILPMLALFLVLQRYFISGITGGAIK